MVLFFVGLVASFMFLDVFFVNLHFFVSHHDFGDNIQNLLVASAASRGAMCGLFDVFKDIKKVFNL